MSKIAKLTLSVPSQILREAKRYAKNHKTSVSAIVTRLFESLSEVPTENQKENTAATFTRASIGVISLPNAKKSDLISSALERKSRR